MKTRRFLIFLTCFSALLRLIQSRLDYTQRFGDETVLANAALNIFFSGNFKDLFFGYGDVLKMPFLFLDGLYFLYGVWQGFFNHLASVAPLEGFIYVNRLMSVATGALAIPAAYFVGKKLFSREGGIVLALLVFANPLQFRYSLYANPDGTAFFFHLLSIGFALDIADPDARRSRRGYFLAGLFAACAIGSKVNSAVALLLPVLVHFFVPRGNFLQKIFSGRLALFFATVVLAYAAVTPTALLSRDHFFHFWSAFFFYTANPTDPQPVFALRQVAALAGQIQKILGSAVFVVLAGAGIFWMLKDWRNRLVLAAGAVWILSFGKFINANTNYGVDAHFFIPTLPYLLIFTAAGIFFACSFAAHLAPAASRFVPPARAAAALMLIPLFTGILNFKKDFTYMGGNNKESFWEYLARGRVDIHPEPMLPLFPNEKEAMGKPFDPGWLDGVRLEGPEARRMTAAGPKDKPRCETLSFWVKALPHSQLLPGSFVVRVKAVREIEGQLFTLHENRYTVAAAGKRNWREDDIALPVFPPAGKWARVELPLRRHLEKDGISWEKTDYLILSLQLLSPYPSLEVLVNGKEGE